MNIRTLEIKTVRIEVPSPSDVNAQYAVTFQDLDAHTVVDGVIKLHLRQGSSAAATLEFTGCMALTTEEVLDKMADWLEGFAKTIRARKAKHHLPVY